MKSIPKIIIIFISITLGSNQANACSILYYKDTVTGKIYVANNEDYWYDVNPYIKLIPESKNRYARLWYGWNDFAQGGVNEFGLFFDAATTPKEPEIIGYRNPGKRNLGDEILSKCKTIYEAVDYLEQQKIALTDGHMFFGDGAGDAIVVEWINGEKKLTSINDHYLIATNFLLADPSKGNYPCPRYDAMKKELLSVKEKNVPVDLKQIGNIAAKAVQVPTKDEHNREGGTLYSTFIDLTDMEFILVYKLDNSKITRLNLREEFSAGKEKKIKLK